MIPLPLLEAALIVTWSSGFVGARFSIDYAPALLVVFWRCVVITLVLFPFVAQQLRRAPAAVLLKNAGIGLLAMGGYLAGITQGIALGVPAGLAALFADLLPMGLALLAACVLGQRLAWQVWAGLIIGLAGAALATSFTSVRRSRCSGPGPCSTNRCHGRWHWECWCLERVSGWLFASRPGKPNAIS